MAEGNPRPDLRQPREVSWQALPREVIDAQRVYIAVKRAYGICTHITCSNPADTDLDYCARCRARAKRGNDKARDAKPKKSKNHEDPWRSK